MILALASLPTLVAAQTDDSLRPDIVFGSDVDAAEAQMRPTCDHIERVTPALPKFPLATEREERLICQGLHASTADRWILHFADGRLEMVEVWAQNLTSSDLLGTPYLGFRANAGEAETVIFDEDLGVAWFMPSPHMHSHPFLGSSVFGGDAPPGASVRLPTGIHVGARVEDVRGVLSTRCHRLQERTIEPAQLPIELDEQRQIDCLGLRFAGFPRKVEFVFADGRLALAWILTGKPEERRVREQLSRAWGPPVRVTDTWEVFGDGSVVLRKDKSEVLIASPQLGQLLMGTPSPQHH